MDKRILFSFFVLVVALQASAYDVKPNQNSLVNAKPFIPSYNSKIVQPYVKQYFGRCDKEGHGFWHKSEHHHQTGQHNHHHYGYLLYHFLKYHMNAKVNNEKIIEIAKKIETEDSTEVLTNLLTALTSDKAEPALKYFASKGLKKENLKKVLNQLKSGNAAEIQKAKDTIHKFAKSIDFAHLCEFDWYYIRYLAAVYFDHLQRVKAKEVVSTDPLEKLVAGLTALATVEERYDFKDIDFKSLLNQLKQQGESARPQVVKVLDDYIDKTDIHTLDIVGFIYNQGKTNAVETTTPPPATTVATTVATTTLPPTTVPTTTVTTTTEATTLPPTTVPPTTAEITTAATTAAPTTTRKTTVAPPVTGLP